MPAESPTVFELVLEVVLEDPRLFESYDLDPSNPKHRRVLAKLVDLMSGEFRLDRRKRGRPKGSKTWDTSMLAKLGRAVDRYEALHPKATLDEIAEAVKSEFPNVLLEPASLRKRFPEARKAHKALQEALRFYD